MNKKFPDRRLELESVFRGILFSLICIFTLPVIVALFILTAAILNVGQGSLASAPFPDSYWKSLLSFAFRISLIPGIVYLTYRGLTRLHDREKRLALFVVSMILFTVLIVMPPTQQHVALSGIASKSQSVREANYRADSRNGGAADKKTPINNSRPRRS